MTSTNKSKSYHYIDIYGKELIVSKARNGNINFILCHDEIIEETTRQEFKSINLSVPKESTRVYKLIEGLYNFSHNRIIVSENPIRDGRNFMFLEKVNDDYNMMVRHDLANELRNPFETKIEVSGRIINDLYEENLNSGPVLTKRLHN